MILLYFMKVLCNFAKIFKTKIITMCFCRLLFKSGQFNINSTREFAAINDIIQSIDVCIVR